MFQLETLKKLRILRFIEKFAKFLCFCLLSSQAIIPLGWAESRG
jgi:hypothetical protein